MVLYIFKVILKIFLIINNKLYFIFVKNMFFVYKKIVYKYYVMKKIFFMC